MRNWHDACTVGVHIQALGLTSGTALGLEFRSLLDPEPVWCQRYCLSTLMRNWHDVCTVGVHMQALGLTSGAALGLDSGMRDATA